MASFATGGRIHLCGNGGRRQAEGLPHGCCLEWTLEFGSDVRVGDAADGSHHNGGALPQRRFQIGADGAAARAIDCRTQTRMPKAVPQRL